MSKGARALALDLLLRTEAAGRYANIALDSALSRSELSGADRALCTALFYSVIEHRITLDHVINTRSSIPPSSIEARVRMILRMALAQLLYFDRIPDHAAVAEAVELTPRRSKGFVNAILRGFLRDGKALCLPDRAADPVRYLSLCYSVPEALAEAFCGQWGAARAERVLAAFSHAPEVTVRVNTLRFTRDDWCAKTGGSPTQYAPHGVRFPSAEGLRDALATGECFVQDEASQIAVAALDAREGMRVIDLCAAPGSKSFGAALGMKNSGEVRSFDFSKIIICSLPLPRSKCNGRWHYWGL
jgi:16S rRNA (cytosine967-C5)-methyltransferase